MRRREFIAFSASTLLASPLHARAQPSQSLRRVGVVTGFSEAEMQRPLLALREKMKELGWTEDLNLRIDARITSGDYHRMAEDIRAFDESVDVLVTTGTPGLTAVRQHAHTVPVVFALVIDPVGQGFVDSLARPGGRVTGLTNFEFPIGGKWLQLIKELDPGVRFVRLLANPGNPVAIPFSRVIEAAGRDVSLEVTTEAVGKASDFAGAVASVSSQSGGAIIVLPDGLAVVHREVIVATSNKHRIPTLYPFRLFPESGGLMSYGVDVPELFREVATYVDRILRGEKPADMPVQAPTKYELIFNLKTAKALNITVPMQLLARADEVIE